MNEAPACLRAVNLISRTALAAVACPKTEANAQWLIIAIASSIKLTARLSGW